MSGSPFGTRTGVRDPRDAPRIDRPPPRAIRLAAAERVKAPGLVRGPTARRFLRARRSGKFSGACDGEEWVLLPRAVEIGAAPRAAALAIAFVVFGAGGAARAQTGSIIIGKDAASSGRGGTDLAIAEGPLAVLTNPAGLAFQRTGAVYGSLRLFSPETGIENDLQDASSEAHFLAGPGFGFTWPFGGGASASEPAPLVIGFGFLPEAGFFTDLVEKTRFFPEGVNTGTEYHILTFAPGAGFRVSDRFSVGASLHYHHSRFDVSGPVEQSVDIFQGEVAPGLTFGDILRQFGTERIQADTDLETTSASGFGGQFGALWRASDLVSIGGFWRPPGFLEDFEGTVDLDFTGVLPEDPDLFPDGLRNSYDARVSGIRYPQMAGAGAALSLRRVRLSADVTWIDWSSAFRKLEIDLTGSENTGYDAIIGDDEIHTEFPLEWRDQWVGALGVEWAFEDAFVARAGLALATNPVPRRTTSPLTPGFARATATLGLGYLGEGFLLDMAFLQTLEETVSVGPESEVSDSYEDSDISFSNWSVVLGVTVLF